MARVFLTRELGNIPCLAHPVHSTDRQYNGSVCTLGMPGGSRSLKCVLYPASKRANILLSSSCNDILLLVLSIDVHQEENIH